MLVKYSPSSLSHADNHLKLAAVLKGNGNRRVLTGDKHCPETSRALGYDCHSVFTALDTTSCESWGRFGISFPFFCCYYFYSLVGWANYETKFNQFWCDFWENLSSKLRALNAGKSTKTTVSNVTGLICVFFGCFHFNSKNLINSCGYNLRACWSSWHKQWETVISKQTIIKKS